MPSVLITGCSSGIGLCLAQKLFSRGWEVYAGARKDSDVKRLETLGLQSIKLDVRDESSITLALDHVLNLSGGKLDALINNAGYGQPGAIEDLRREVIIEQFETNLFGPMSLTNRVIPIMRRQGSGRIINISSVLGFAAMPYRGAYNASKFAIEGWSDTLRMELAHTGINVSLIEPGPILTNFRANSLIAFKQNIEIQKSNYQNEYTAMLERLNKKGSTQPFTRPPEAVLEKVIHALESSKPKIRYYVTFPTYLFAFLRHILPWKLLDACLRMAGKN
ncbi:MAG TPA: SDR family NAD(P)-dependent oxidoreductase [Burkholderiales bacterium]|nr:SDR family NAD(P)-dependent oxidoreductase [Burkholderiales bacterium]